MSDGSRPGALLPALHSNRLSMPRLAPMSQPMWPSPPGSPGSAGA
jgi:hypothetical protein